MFNISREEDTVALSYLFDEDDTDDVFPLEHSAANNSQTDSILPDAMNEDNFVKNDKQRNPALLHRISLKLTEGVRTHKIKGNCF